MRVLFWNKGHFAQRELIAALALLPITLIQARTLDEVLAGLPETDLLMATDCPAEQAARLVSALGASPVGWFQFLSAGREHVLAAGLLQHVEQLGIGASLAQAIGEHGMALALALYRRIPHALSLEARQNWTGSRAIVRKSLEGDTALIVGLGAIGRDLARRCSEMGMRVVAVTRSPRPDVFCEVVLPLAALSDRLPEAGTVFLSLALTPETRHLIGEEALARMRPDAYLINLARGGLVDQQALAAALSSGRLAGAGLDVTDPEPLPVDDPLWQAPNLIVTPHVAVSGSVRSAERLAAVVAGNITCVIEARRRRT